VPLSLSILQRSSAIISLEVDVTARSNELPRDGRMPICGRDVERRVPFLVLKIDVTASCNELFSDVVKPFCGRDVERCASILRLKIDVTASCNELFRDSLMPFLGSEVERRAPILLLKIDATASSNELFRDGRMPSTGRAMEGRVPMRALVVHEGLRALCRQQRVNLRCITNTRGFPKLLPRHSFPAPSLCFLNISLQLVHQVCSPRTNLQTRTGDMSGYQ